MNQNRHIICMKWGDLYDATYVNVLFKAALKNSSIKPKFICLTDDGSGLHPDIIVRSIPDYSIPQKRWNSGAWPKLTVFAPELNEFKGRALFIDLDMVILQSLDPFFDLEGGVIMIDGGQNWKTRTHNDAPSPMSSIFAFDIGGQSSMFSEFANDQNSAYTSYRLEQDFLGAEAHDVKFWPLDWVSSFKWHLRRPLFIDRILAPHDPPVETKVLVFHGDPRPIDLLKIRWRKSIRVIKGPVKWMTEYWKKYSH